MRDVFSSNDVYVLDGGDCQVGIESTIIEIQDSGLEILRPGTIPYADLKQLADSFQLEITVKNDSKINAPGTMNEHYRPQKDLYSLSSTDQQSAIEKLSKHISPLPSLKWITLNKDPLLAARELYQQMRVACQGSEEAVGVWIDAEVLKSGDWSGVLDRLKKASTQSFISLD